MAEFTHMLENEYARAKITITKHNPQANSNLEHVHKTTGNMIRMFSVLETSDNKHLLNRILSAVAFAVHAKVHTTTRATLEETPSSKFNT
jgi:hypothetical protein